MPAKRPHVLVVGDVMLDEYLVGTATRRSPEEPTAPVVAISERSRRLGGAANVARNVVSLGGRATVAGAIGTDEAGAAVKRLLREAGIGVFLVEQRSRPTTVKTRVYDGDRQLARVDAESVAPLPIPATRAIARYVALRKPDMVVISDYAKGVLSERLVKALVRSVGGERIVADVKPVHAGLVSGLRAITPNRAEAAAMLGVEIRDDAQLAKVLAGMLGTSAVVTLGAKGAAVFDRERDEGYLVAPHRVEEHDVTGAGDTLTAALALMLAREKGLAEAVAYAGVAAALAVSKRGTVAPSGDEVAEAMRKR